MTGKLLPSYPGEGAILGLEQKILKFVWVGTDPACRYENIHRLLFTYMLHVNKEDEILNGVFFLFLLMKIVLSLL